MHSSTLQWQFMDCNSSLLYGTIHLLLNLLINPRASYSHADVTYRSGATPPIQWVATNILLWILFATLTILHARGIGIDATTGSMDITN